MEFLESIRSVTSVPSSWGFALVIVVAIASAIYIWRRTRSTYSLMAKIWQLFHGKKECKEGPVRDFLDQQSALMQFRFITGVPTRTLKQTRALIEWTEKNNEDMGDVAACGNYFDLESIELKEEEKLAKLWQVVLRLIATALLAAVSLIFFVGATFDTAIFQMKQSRVYFTLSVDYAKRIGKDGGLSREQCVSGERVTSSGFSQEDTSIICKIFTEKPLALFITKTVREQRIVFVLGAIAFAWYFWGMFVWLMQGVKSREMFKRLRKRRPQGPLTLVVESCDGNIES